MSAVRQALQSALDESGGRIPFDTFMQIALHDPEGGYYAQNIRGVGARGDFTTLPQRGPALGRAVAGWLRGEAALRGWKKWHVIECGPGMGSLANEVMGSFGWLERRRISLHLVETSRPLRAKQERALRRFKPSWHESVSSALAACGGKALIYHNEFFDAFPCRVFRKDGGDWAELYLRVSGGKLAEHFAPPERPRPASTAFEREWPEGQRVEVFGSVRGWMREIAPLWREGAMLCIDYGGTPEEVYHRRPAGTLRAYREQRRLEGPSVYELPGRQDITADVNVDDVAMWAREAGWIPSGTSSLTELAPDIPAADAFRAVRLTKPPRSP